MKNMIELSKEEAIHIDGGNLYEIGYSVGHYCADCFDFYKGIWDGIFK